MKAAEHAGHLHSIMYQAAVQAAVIPCCDDIGVHQFSL